MDCGMPWRPPQIPAVTTCHVSAAYKSEHDGHTLARRFLQRANTVCCRPAPSTPTRWIGRAQNPAPATFDHQRSNPDHAARLTNWLTASGDGRPATTGHPSGADAQSLPEPACMTVTLTAGSDNPATKTSGPANHGDQHRSQRRGGSRPLGAPVRRRGPDQPYRDHRCEGSMTGGCQPQVSVAAYSARLVRTLCAANGVGCWPTLVQQCLSDAVRCAYSEPSGLNDARDRGFYATCSVLMGLRRAGVGRVRLGGVCRSCRIGALSGCELSIVRPTTRLRFV